ncbi:hypothetical protein [Bacillus sp. OK048]|uniref:hypothetical protein n=1 Tax=Bacillus sp. OK048 TaxID=1882761 RepID=UPI0008916E77|nr:hypothetical protein [Bacillus sp. OK048]SDM85794.1 hypothetical protein SAMN05443253_10671 [Bacillus sp. OK048]
MKGLTVFFLLLAIIAIIIGTTADFENAPLIGWAGGVIFLILSTLTAVKRRS